MSCNWFVDVSGGGPYWGYWQIERNLVPRWRMPAHHHHNHELEVVIVNDPWALEWSPGQSQREHVLLRQATVKRTWPPMPDRRASFGGTLPGWRHWPWNTTIGDGAHVGLQLCLSPGLYFHWDLHSKRRTGAELECVASPAWRSALQGSSC